LVHWVVAGLRAAGVRELTILLNSSGDAVRDYLRSEFPALDWTFLREDTATSWESFRLVSLELARQADRFALSTVDALIPAAETARFLAESVRAPEPDAALAVTRFVEDEKPLWADLAEDGRVTALGAAAVRRDAVTCGLYMVSRKTAQAMPEASAFGKLREFWGGLVSGGCRVRGVVLSRTVDVDRAEDLPAAEGMISCLDV